MSDLFYNKGDTKPPRDPSLHLSDDGEELSGPTPPSLPASGSPNGEDEELLDDDFEESTVILQEQISYSDQATPISELPSAREATVVGRYEIVYPLADGGFSTIYVGRLKDTEDLDDLIALKIMDPHLVENRSFIDVIFKKVRLTAGIEHPNVVKILEISNHEDKYFIASEFVFGQNLQQVQARALEMEVKIPHPIYADILSRICLGLHEAHELGATTGEKLNMVHGGVSTRSILLSYDGGAKLVDFGTAWARGDLSEKALDSVKEKIGFMSPEQLLGEKLERSADIFGLGVVLYTLVTGTPPFKGKSEAERLKKIVTGDYLAPRDKNPLVDAELQIIIQKAMAPLPSDRFSTAKELGSALEEYVRNSGQNAESSRLADFMEQLFADDIERHHAKIWNSRQTQSSAVFPITEDHAEKQESDDKRGSFLDRTKRMAFSKRIAAAAAILLIAGFAAVALNLQKTTDMSFMSFSKPISKKARPSTSLPKRSAKTKRKETPKPAPTKKEPAAAPKDKNMTTKTVAVSDDSTKSDGDSTKSDGDSTKSDGDSTKSDGNSAKSDGNSAKSDGDSTKSKVKTRQVKLKLVGLKKNASVYLDGQQLTPPFRVDFSRKTAILKVTAPGRANFKKKIIPNRNRKVRVKLVKLAKKSKRRKIRKKAEPSESAKKPAGWEDNPFK